MLSTDWLAPGTSTKYRPARSGLQAGGSGSEGAGPSHSRPSRPTAATISSRVVAPVTWRAASSGLSARS